MMHLQVPCGAAPELTGCDQSQYLVPYPNCARWRCRAGFMEALRSPVRTAPFKKLMSVPM